MIAADNSGCSSDITYMGLTEPCGDIFQRDERKQDLETINGPLPPHMLTAEVKIIEGGVNGALNGAGMEEKTFFGGKNIG